MMDARGIPSAVCPNCGSNMFVIVATFDPESYELDTYLLDGSCLNCGTLLTIPTPEDIQEEEEQF